jgi:hypothetical protein
MQGRRAHVDVYLIGRHFLRRLPWGCSIRGSRLFPDGSCKALTFKTEKAVRQELRSSSLDSPSGLGGPGLEFQVRKAKQHESTRRNDL